MAGMGIADLENMSLRDRLKAARKAGQVIKKLLEHTKMTPWVREAIMSELLWITNYDEALKEQRKVSKEMKEISAEALMRVYNKMFTPPISLGEVKVFLETNAFFHMPVDLAAKIMHEAIERSKK